jgi:hypothetical protein
LTFAFCLLICSKGRKAKGKIKKQKAKTMAYPKIIYGSPATALTFQRLPRKVPAYWMDALRHNNTRRPPYAGR